MAVPSHRRPRRRTHKSGPDWRERLPLVALATVVVAAFLFGGGARGDITSLVVLRPLAIVCLGFGLYGLTRDQWHHQRGPLTLLALVVVLIALHLVPLPPFLWSNLPGRGIVVHGDAVAGLEGVWRPIALVPFRGWNALWSMAVPAAALVLAARIGARDNAFILRLILALVLASALFGLTQAVSGYNPSLFTYRVTNGDSPVGLFANKNHQAAALCTALPLLALVAASATGAARTTVRFACAGLAVVVLLVLLATGSRGGLGFLVVAVAGTALIYWKAGLLAAPTRSGPRWLIPAVATAALMTIVAIAFLFARAGAIERVASADPAEESRLAVWQVTAATLSDYLPFGSGIGSFVEVFAMNEPAPMLSLNYWNHAHNDVLEWIFEGGLPAAALIIAAIVMWVRKTRQAWVRLPRAEPRFLMAATGSLIVFILGLWSLVDYPLRVPAIAVLASIAAAWLNGTQLLGDGNQTGGKERLRPEFAGDRNLSGKETQ